MHPEIKAYLLEKYLNEKCTVQEREMVENWYASLSGSPDYLGTLSESEQFLFQQEVFEYIENQIYTKNKFAKFRFTAFHWLAGAAASLTIGFGIYFFTKAPENTTVVPVAVRTEKQPVSDFINFQNDMPKMVMHQLPDGSTVWMHAGAEISYPKVFEQGSRAVTFTGEGFFDIRHEKKRPFLIRSGDMQIKVLGTKFNVKAKEKQKLLEVAVVSGSVSVSAAGKENTQREIILKPKQKAFFETGSKRLTFIKMPVQVKKEIFEPVTILFEDTPLTSVVRQLEQRFETHIHLVNPDMRRCKLTADFEQQPLPSILELLCASLDASYTMSENTILIDGAACK
jgi:transmembrane sensor